ncbi:MAG: nicotinate-nucleotide adenylyltransferase [Clostridia bacterium]|nr:nicotinate-nucleotide adenylyltransferase [Clostridia bacterium]
MKIGILGGTLDPVHNGHIEIAMAAMAALGLDQVALMPSGDPPHKTRATDRLDRLRMAELAAEGRPGLYASDLEIRRQGRTYTVDTLSTLAVEHPEVEWTYILGADALNKLDTWKEFPRIARLCSFAAVSRPGCDEDLARLRAGAISSCYHTRVDLLPVSGPPLSSTAVRKRVAEGVPIDDCVPGPVADYIRRKGLYLCKYSEAQILDRLKGMLTWHRFTHTLGVADTAQRLAAGCGVEPLRARLAGLLHDCAKSMPLDEMRELVVKNLPDIDEEELDTRAILHAPAGMVMARDVFGVRDASILSAIRKHTVGDGQMSPMDALIYVSDFIEPGREPFPGLEKARKLAEKDIYRAMVCCTQLTAKHLKSQGKHVHPRSQALLDHYDK